MTQPTPNRLFAAMDTTWPPARLIDFGPWKLREGLGGGQRVSAATVCDHVTESDIENAECGMRSLAQRPLFMVRPEDTALDTWLAARGYQTVDPVTIYLAPSKALTQTLERSAVIPVWPPLAAQKELWANAGIGPARLAVMQRCTTPRTALLARQKDAPAGTAFVAIDGDIAMLHALEVVHDLRKLGVGTRVMQGAANWALARNATWLALAVVNANGPANALYRKLGFTMATAYHYRRAPEALT